LIKKRFDIVRKSSPWDHKRLLVKKKVGI